MLRLVELSAEEQRVLGCLIEKGALTPEHYPLTMNALVAACNQSSNRDPIVTYREDTVTAALTSLREQKLTRIVYPAHARVTKYRHVLDEVLALTAPELAVIAVLLLRGAQTENELVTRTERYGDLSDLGGVPGVLNRLGRRPEPLVQLVGRRPGQREDRYLQLLGPTDVVLREGSEEGPASRSGSLSDRVLALEADTAILREELTGIKELLEDLLAPAKPPPAITVD
jgi:uncharacterized protein YceH (UPF0502 family)